MGGSICSLVLQYLQDQTGVTWNKRFRKQFGPVVKVSGTQGYSVCHLASLGVGLSIIMQI